MKSKMRRFLLSVGAVSALFLTSCSTVYPGSGAGFIYTNVTEGQTATSIVLAASVVKLRPLAYSDLFLQAMLPYRLPPRMLVSPKSVMSIQRKSQFLVLFQSTQLSFTENNSSL